MEGEGKKKYNNLKVYISGYGPFMNIKDNPSQKLVELIMKSAADYNKSNWDIVHDTIYEVDVDYVTENISSCHSLIKENLKCGDENLHLIIHFGVSCGSKAIHLESIAKNYIQDYVNSPGKIHDCEEDNIVCKLDLDSIAKILQSKNHKVCTSLDAGSYLCNYIYFKSSYEFQKCENVISLFIHIPDQCVCSTEECKNFFFEFIDHVSNDLLVIDYNGREEN